MNFSATMLTKSRFIFLIFFLFFFPCKEIFAQAFTVSEISSRFLNDNDYDSLIHIITLPIAQKNKVTVQDFDVRYSNHRYKFMEALVPLWQSRFSLLDNTYQNIELIPGTPAYRRARTLYFNLAKEVIESVLSGTNLFSILFATDFSDRILSFHAIITVKPNGSLLVSEFITIFNGNGQTSIDNESSSSPTSNNDIQRGITRDFPTSYEDKNGFWSEVGFQLKGVFKNGEAEPYAIETLNNGIRIRIGKKELILPEGKYEYRIDYETDRQLIFHRDKDELYWNVNGNGWVFTADSVSCLVNFPKGALIKEYACYSGLLGATDRNCNFRVPDESSVFFSTTKRLNAYEGLTVAVSIQKGILSPPAMINKVMAFLKTNYILPALSFLLLFLFCFYFIIWYRKGRDPEQGVIYPRFSPPAGLNPADTGYIMDQRYGTHLFAAALVEFAVKRYLEIEVKTEGFLKFPVYYFKRPKDIEDAPSTRDEYGFSLGSLYGQTVKRGTYNSSFKSFSDSLEDILKTRFLIQKGKPGSVNGLFMLNKAYTRFGGILLLSGIILSIFFLIGHPSQNLLIITILMMVSLIALHIVFVRIMSAYTRQGRDIADHILGFKMYLEQAEQRMFNELAPPEKTLELFEKYLPYAIALKVENEWAAKFENIMQHAMEEGYQPGYYVGSHIGFSMNTMSRQISSGLSGSISSASTPPSSSSGGSGGGGSSGGGGGGGGGGGW